MTPGTLAQIACVIEATARKPGNVHRFRDFKGTTYLDFVLSALAIGPAMDAAAAEGVGATCLRAVEATRGLVATNTNLGIIILLAPLAAVPPGEDLREGVARVLANTKVEDARLVYRAIRLAQPGGLGRVGEQDVAGEPSVTLVEAMTLAADRDAVARQYANGFSDVFDRAGAGLADALAAGRPLETAVVAAHLRVLSELPDTLIARKRGAAEAAEASSRARDVLAAGWPDTAEGDARCRDLDAWLRAEGNGRNPGASADLVTAALFAALREGTIPTPLPTGPAWGFWAVAGQHSQEPPPTGAGGPP